eukprot:4267206-Pyramimonas_sp.AAC.1
MEPLWAHETCVGCARLGGADTYGLRPRDPRWSSLWGHETCEGCAEIGRAGSCGLGTGTFGGALFDGEGCAITV